MKAFLIVTIFFLSPTVFASTPNELIFGHDLFYFLNQRLTYDHVTCDTANNEVSNLLEALWAEPNLLGVIVWECNKVFYGDGIVLTLKYALKPKNGDGRKDINGFVERFNKHPFLGGTLSFQRVARIVASAETLISNASGTVSEESVKWTSHHYDDETLPGMITLEGIIESKSADDFLRKIGEVYGKKAKEKFKRNIGQVTFMSITYDLTVLLENGESVDTLSGWYSNKDCGNKPCFSVNQN